MILASIILVKRLKKDGAFSFNRNPARPFKQIFAELKEHGNLRSFSGIQRKLSFLYIAIFDKRCWRVGQKNAQGQIFRVFPR